MTNIGELSVGIGLDYSELDKQIAGLGGRYKDIKFSSSFDGKGMEAEFRRYRDKFSRQTVSVGLSLNGAGLESEFKRYRDKFSGQSIDVGVRFQVDARDLRQQIQGIVVPISLAQSGDFDGFADKVGDRLSRAIEKAMPTKSLFQKLAGGAVGAFTGIAGGIFSAILFPFKAAIGGLGVVFGGAGLKIGEELSQGLSKGLGTALEDAVGDSVGSTEALGKQLGKALSDGLGVVLEETLGRKVSASVGKAANQFVGEAVVTRESKSRQTRSQDEVEVKRQQAIAALAKEYQVASIDRPRGEALRDQVKAQAPGLARQRAEFNRRFSAEQGRLSAQSELINVNLSREQVAAKVNQSLKAAGAKQRVSPEEVTQKQIDYYNSFLTSQKRLQYVQLGLIGQFGDAKAQLDSQEKKLQAQAAEANKILGRIGAAFRGLEVLGGLKPGQGLPAPQIPKTPKLYKEFVKETAQASGVSVPDAANIPKLRAGDATSLGGVAEYDAAMNSIQVQPEVYRALVQGKVEDLTEDALDAVVHELRHAIQYNFGKSKKLEVDLLRPNQEEIKQLGTKIEASTGVQAPELQPLARKLESDAYTFSARNRQAIRENITRRQVSADIEQQFGIGGAKTTTRTGALIDKLAATKQIAQTYGIEGNAELASAQKAITSVIARLNPLREKARNLDILPTEEILKLQQDFSEAIKEEEEAFKQVLAAQSKIINRARQVQELGANPQLLQREILLSTVASQKNIEQSRIEQERSLEQTNEKARKQAQVLAKRQLAAKKKTQIVEPELPKAVEAAVTPEQDNTKAVEAKILKAARDNQSNITKTLKRAFKGTGKNRQVVDEELANLAVDAIGEQIAFLEKQLSRTDLSGQARAEIGRLRGTSQGQNRAYGLLMTRLRSQSLNASSQSQSVATPRSVSQSRGNSFDRLAAFGDIDPLKAVQQEVERLQRVIGNTVKNQRRDSSVNRSLKELERRTKQAEQASASAESARQRLDESNQKFVENAEIIANERIKAARQLQQMERELTPDMEADVAVNDRQKQQERVSAELKRLRANPRAYLRERSKNATITRARYIGENAPAIAGLVDAKIGANPTAKQANTLTSLQSNFQKFGEAASNYQEAPDDKHFVQLKNVIIELEKDLKAAGVPLRNINQEIDKYTENLRQLQAEGKISLDVDVESLAPQKINRINDEIGRLGEQLGEASNPGNRLISTLGGLVKGFFAFQSVSFFAQNLRAFSAEAFQAAIAASNLRTSLNFSEGGIAQGGQALGFVRKTVEDLKIPLQSSAEGYAKLSGSTKGTTAQGKTTRELFTGVSEAATVQGLTADRVNNVYVALSQIAAKGTVSLEELRGQLAENLPGALTIAAQGMGMTQEQLMKLIETGQLASSDFLPRFAAALHANFGDAAKEASGNAQSALYNLQNSIQILKESFGEAIAPVSAAGLNAMSVIFTTLGKHGGELATVIAGLSVALALQLAVSIKATLGTGSALDIFFLGIRKAVAGTWAAIAPMMGQMLLIMGAVVVAIEGFKIASRYINGGELAQQFKQMEDAAARTAKGIGGVKEAILDLNNTEPPAQGWSDQAILNSRQVNREGIDSQFERYGALGGAGSAIMKTPLGALGGKLAGSLGGIKTIAESDRDKAVASIIQAGKDIEKAQADVVGRLTDPNYNKGAIGSSLFNSAEGMMGRDPRTEVDVLKDSLKGVDDQLQSVSQQRKTLQAEISRNYANLGKAVPPELKEQLAALSVQFQDLSTQRTDIAKPYQEQLQNVQKAIEQTKTQLDFLSTPEGAAQFRGAKIDGKEVGLDELKKRLQENLDKSKDLKNALETLVQSVNADPVLTLTEAFRGLNLELAKLQEKSAFRAASDSLNVAQGQLAGFDKDPYYQGRGALEGAKKERDRINADNQGLAKNIAERQKLLESGANQAIMQQLGVDENSSAAEIQNRLDTNKDMTDAEKGVLENLKKIQEDRLKLQQGLSQSAESELKVRQQIQQNTVDQITFEAGNRDAKIRQGENATQERIQQEQGKMGADRAVEELSKIPVQTTNKQIESAKTQLEAYKQAYKKGLIDRRTYLEKERDLTTQMSDLQRTKREQIEQQITDTIARHAAIREATIRRDANAAMIAIRQDQKNLDPRTAIKQMEAQPLLQTDQSIQAAQAQLKEYRQAFEQGQINAKTYADKERELTTQMSDLRRQKVEQIEQQVTGVIARNTADRQALIKREETDAIASIRRRYLDRQITEKQATEEAAKISRDTTDQSIRDVETQLAAYQRAYKDGSLNAKDYVDKERDLTTQLHELKKQQIEQEIALRDAANARILEGIELANRLAEAQIQEFSDAQTQLIKQGQLAGRPEYVASRELEQTQAEVLRSQITDTQRRMGETDDLYRQGVITDPKQYTEQRIQLEQQLAQQQIQLLDNQISQQKRLREEQSKAIDDRIRGQERSQELANAQLDLQSKGIEMQVKEVELIQKADELSKQLLDSRHNLAKALGDADVGQTQIKLDAMSRGKDLMSKVVSDDRFTLNTSDADIANLKATIGSQLGELGVGVDFDSIRQLKRSAGMGNVGAQQQLNQYEIAILDARSRLEEEMAAKRLNALGLEQQFARENLEMELRRGELQARSALFASKQAEFQLQQSKLQLESQVKLAQLEEEKAKLIEDPRDRVRAIADARAKMELATGQLNLVPDQLTNAQGLSAIATENVSAQEELALNARRAMEATQSNERSQFVAAQNARKQAEQLERAEAAAKRTAAANAAGSGGLNFTNLNEQQKQQLDEAMKTMETYSQPMPENRRKAGLVAAASGTDNPFLSLLLRQQGDKDIADIADKMKSNATPFSGMARSQLMMASQMGDKDVVGELQKLNENMSKMASEPRSISVSTATPMEDTMKIMSDINRPR